MSLLVFLSGILPTAYSFTAVFIQELVKNSVFLKVSFFCAWKEKSMGLMLEEVVFVG